MSDAAVFGGAAAAAGPSLPAFSSPSFSGSLTTTSSSTTRGTGREGGSGGGRLDAFVERCHEVLSLVQTMGQYARLARYGWMDG